MIYLSGKISGRLEWYYRFYAWRWARKLARQGLNVLCPHMIFHGLDYAAYMANDLDFIDRCDAVYMLPNWKTSRGARIEKAYAERIGKEVVYL